MTRGGRIFAVAAGLVALVGLAPAIAPHRASDQFVDRDYAPPMWVHVRDASGWHAPFVYRQVLEDRLMRRFSEDRAARIPLRWGRGGSLVSVDEGGGPLLLLGADSLGRDVFSRLMYGAQLSLGVALIGLLGALTIGTIVGGLAGSQGGWIDSVLMLAADAVLVLPGVYLVLVLRGALPLVLSTEAVFALMAGLFAISGWPHVARGVRAIVAAERSRDYADAARAAGAGPFRLMRHLLPAARGFLGVEVVLLVPALLVAEATVSFLGLGFPEPKASWGTMLQEAANVSVMQSAPWMLAPAAALFLVVLALQVAAGRLAERSMLPGRPVLGERLVPIDARR
jgi:peptide/nickel transport system permease protein